jgi:glycosyltransferase involved in cell wall biosynthesis
MCIYNGERFLVEQLESILNQTCQPETVIIYDDCSTDSSINIIKQFIAKYNLASSWEIRINPFRKGWRMNFYDAIMECEGDYIFFCDQDDIWYPDKISIMIKTMQNNPNIFVLTGFYKTIDANGHPINVMDWTSNNIYNSNIIKSNLAETIFHWKPRIGCTMVIQKIIKDKIKYFERNDNFAHDIWALYIGSLLGGCYHINHLVIQYRVHENNASAKPVVNIPNREERILELENKVKYLEYIYNGARLINTALFDKNEYSVLLKSIAFYKFKLIAFKNYKLTYIFGLFRYISIYFKYFNLKEYLIDIFEIIRLRDRVRMILRLMRSIKDKKHCILQ